MRNRFVLSAMVGFCALYAGFAHAEGRLILKGGLGLFTSDLGNVTSAGPAWGLILNYQPMEIFGIEFGYEGSRNSLSDPRAPQSTGLFRNSGVGLVKLYLPLASALHPFAGAGLGLGYVIVQGQSSPAYGNGFIAELPVAAGIEVEASGVRIGARATYHYFLTQEFSKDLSSVNGAPALSGGLFDISATITFRF
jgi:hypothetical protein